MPIRSATLTMALGLATLLAAPTGGAIAQTGLAAGKDCRVVRTCDFRRSSAVRGCLSSYSCRQCRFVKVCTSGRCEWRSRCPWGGVGS